MRRRRIAASFVGLFIATVATALVSPEEHLGRPTGTDFKLADWDTISDYFHQLGEDSERVDVRIVGTTTEGRDFIAAVISDEENLANLDEIKENARRIADPRGLTDEEANAAVENGKVVLFITCNMHSTEIASAEMSMDLAYALATSDEEPWASARREMVVVLIPSQNPDGTDRVVHWYREIQGTPYESAGLTELYQHYAGHDNNRDWFALSLEETRLTTRLIYQEWFPQVYWDVHQQSSTGERLFVPPFRDPLNPNLDPAIVAGIGALGGRMLLDLTVEGFTGVSTGVTYDLWWNGGNRNVPARHNIVGLLTEAASANLASPVYLPKTRLRGPSGIPSGDKPSNRFPAPWPGGWWRVGDIARYEMAAARSLLGSLSREPETWRRNALETARRAVERGEHDAPYAWLVTTDNADRDALRRLFKTLIVGGVEIEAAQNGFTADGLDYPTGTLVIRRAQPYGAYVKDLFEPQRYPDGPPPYDVSGWTLPLLYGVRRVEVVNEFKSQTRRVATVEDALDALPSPPAVAHLWPSLDGRDSDSIRGVFALLEAGTRMRMVYGKRNGGEVIHGAGDWVVRPDRADEAGALLKELGLKLTAPNDEVRDDMGVAIERRRIGVYAPWSASMDEGWTRWALDRYDVPYERLRNEAIRAGNLGSHVDVIIIPSMSPRAIRDGRSDGTVFPQYAGGLAPEGLVALEEFVRQGGTLITFDQASDFAIDLFGLDVEKANEKSEDDRTTRFECPGSVLRTIPQRESPWTAGFGPSLPVFYSNSRAYKSGATQDHFLTFPKSGVLLSGWAKNEDVIADGSAWLRLKVEQGQVHLFGIRPQYRSWSHAAFKALFRAILLPVEAESQPMFVEG